MSEIIVGYDGSAGAEVALATAVALAGKTGDGVALIFCYEAPAMRAGGAGDQRDVIESIGREILEGAVARHGTDRVPMRAELVDAPAGGRSAGGRRRVRRADDRRGPPRRGPVARRARSARPRTSSSTRASARSSSSPPTATDGTSGRAVPQREPSRWRTSSRKTFTSRGASMPRRTWSPRTSRTVTTTSSPMTMRSLSLRVSTNTGRNPFRGPRVPRRRVAAAGDRRSEAAAPSCRQESKPRVIARPSASLRFLASSLS